MKTLLKSIVILAILQGCSSSKFVLQEYRNDLSLYYASHFTLEDGRVYDEYPNTMCQLDECTVEEFVSALAGQPLFKRSQTQIKSPLLTTQYEKILRTAVENLETGSGVNPATVSLKISCIGFDNEGGLQVTIKGEMTHDGILVWKSTGVAMRQYSFDVTWEDIQKEDWNQRITETTVEAIKDCLKHLPKNQ